MLHQARRYSAEGYVDVISIPTLPATKADLMSGPDRFGDLASVAIRAMVSIAFFPAAPSKATLVSSAFSIAPPFRNTSACHSQLPVIDHSNEMPWTSSPMALIFLASVITSSHVFGRLFGSPPAFRARSRL